MSPLPLIKPGLPCCPKKTESIFYPPFFSKRSSSYQVLFGCFEYTPCSVQKEETHKRPCPGILGGGGGKIGKSKRQKSPNVKVENWQNNNAQNQLCCWQHTRVVKNNRTNKTQASRFWWIEIKNQHYKTGEGLLSKNNIPLYINNISIDFIFVMQTISTNTPALGAYCPSSCSLKTVSRPWKNK